MIAHLGGILVGEHASTRHAADHLLAARHVARARADLQQRVVHRCAAGAMLSARRLVRSIVSC